MNRVMTMEDSMRSVGLFARQNAMKFENVVGSDKFYRGHRLVDEDKKSPNIYAALEEPR